MPLSRVLRSAGLATGLPASRRIPLYATGSPRPRTPRPAPRVAGALGGWPALLVLRPVHFGLDFGTSNTSLAVTDGTSTRVLPIDAVAGETMPTVLYVRRDGTPIVGRAAIDAYLEDNRTRGPITRQFQLLGIRMTSSDNKTSRPVEAHIYTDTSSPGRLFQALKTFLGDPLETRTNVFGDAKGLEDLIALILAHVRKRSPARHQRRSRSAVRSDSLAVTTPRLARPAGCARPPSSRGFARSASYQSRSRRRMPPMSARE